MTIAGVNLWTWLHRVLGWDGVLPVGIALLPAAIDLLLPNNGDALQLAASTVPLVALVVRYRVGCRHIEANNVGPVVRFCQFAVFFAALFLLCLFDGFVIMIHLGGALQADDLKGLAVVYGVYLLAMTFPMFPGPAKRDTPQPEVAGNSLTPD